MTAHLLYFLSICFILWFVYPAPPSLIIQRNYCFFFIWRRRDIAVDSLITMMISIFLCLFDVSNRICGVGIGQKGGERELDAEW